MTPDTMNVIIYIVIIYVAIFNHILSIERPIFCNGNTDHSYQNLNVQPHYWSFHHSLV
jgi:hypothetical protein